MVIFSVFESEAGSTASRYIELSNPELGNITDLDLKTLIKQSMAGGYYSYIIGSIGRKQTWIFRNLSLSKAAELTLFILEFGNELIDAEFSDVEATDNLNGTWTGYIVSSDVESISNQRANVECERKTITIEFEGQKDLVSQ